eukprot:COSAG02_NODE_3079_length_7411_cov_31.125957_10_plen_66_part_00
MSKLKLRDSNYRTKECVYTVNIIHPGSPFIHQFPVIPVRYFSNFVEWPLARLAVGVRAPHHKTAE